MCFFITSIQYKVYDLMKMLVNIYYYFKTETYYSLFQVPLQHLFNMDLKILIVINIVAKQGARIIIFSLIFRHKITRF